MQRIYLPPIPGLEGFYNPFPLGFTASANTRDKLRREQESGSESLVALPGNEEHRSIALVRREREQ